MELIVIIDLFDYSGTVLPSEAAPMGRESYGNIFIKGLLCHYGLPLTPCSDPLLFRSEADVPHPGHVQLVC